MSPDLGGGSDACALRLHPRPTKAADSADVMAVLEHAGLILFCFPPILGDRGNASCRGAPSSAAVFKDCVHHAPGRLYLTFPKDGKGLSLHEGSFRKLQQFNVAILVSLAIQ